MVASSPGVVNDGAFYVLIMASSILTLALAFLKIWLGFFGGMQSSNYRKDECAGRAAAHRRSRQQLHWTSSGPWKGVISSRRAFLLGAAPLLFCVGSVEGGACGAGQCKSGASTSLCGANSNRCGTTGPFNNFS